MSVFSHAKSMKNKKHTNNPELTGEHAWEMSDKLYCFHIPFCLDY